MILSRLNFHLYVEHQCSSRDLITDRIMRSKTMLRGGVLKVFFEGKISFVWCRCEYLIEISDFFSLITFGDFYNLSRGCEDNKIFPRGYSLQK